MEAERRAAQHQCDAIAAKAQRRDADPHGPSASGIATPTADDLVRLDRARTGKKLSNADWESPIDPDAQDRQAERWPHPFWPAASPLMRWTLIPVRSSRPNCTQPTRATIAHGLSRSTLEAAMEQLAALDAAPTPEGAGGKLITSSRRATPATY